mmetsp:Transcript_53693/g.142314  ORF Transcript_53693/g.142314 Transcript_53693/m.142314 type:complete len:244 (+) Transcript_53693:44-775(+)
MRAARVHPNSVEEEWRNEPEDPRFNSETYWQLGECSSNDTSTSGMPSSFITSLSMKETHFEELTPDLLSVRIADPLCWSGWLHKKGQHPFWRWRQRWFHIVESPSESRELLLCYSYDSRCRSPKLFRVVDFHRNRRHEDKFCFAFSLALAPFRATGSQSPGLSNFVADQPSNAAACAPSTPHADGIKHIIVAVESVTAVVGLAAFLVSSLHPSLANAARQIEREAPHGEMIALEMMCQLKPLW